MGEFIDPEEGLPDLVRQMQNLPQEALAKFERFVDMVNAVTEEVFGAENPDLPFSLVVGLQFDGMGQSNDLPVCLVSSNLSPCGQLLAVGDMMEYAEANHRVAHMTGEAGSGYIMEETDPAALPEHIREAIAEYARSQGMDASKFLVQEVADVRDLDALPTYTPEEG